MGRGQVASKQQNSVESYGGSPMPLEGLRGSSQVKSFSTCDVYVAMFIYTCLGYVIGMDAKFLGLCGVRK